MTKLTENSVITKDYCIDSFKLSIDVDNFTSTNIPDNFILIDKDSGEVLQEFKKKSLQVPYKNTTIYIGIHEHNLRGVNYTKLILLFSSKVAGVNYFNGIKKHDVINVLEYLKQLGYISYTDVYRVFSELYTTDTDIKVDYVFDDKFEAREKVAEYNKELVQRFQYEKPEIHSYNNVNNLGLQTFNRDRSTLTRPFVKWYDKYKEFTAKHRDFFISLPPAVQNILEGKFVYRFEFTMKDKKFFANFGISNRLEDVLNVDNYKWWSVSNVLLDALFEYRVRKIRDTSKLKTHERVLAIQMIIDLKTMSASEIRNKYTSAQPDKDSKYRANILFDKIYQSIDNNSPEIAEMKEKYEIISYFDTIFGFGKPSA